jgi:predicted lipid-binding transport protein (Tim44 family)
MERKDKTMMMGGMAWMFFWTLLFIAVIVAVIWLVVRALRPQRIPMTTPPGQSQGPSPYQQGYQSTVPEPETYQEGGQTYPYPEQPFATYPHTPQEQQEQQPHF